MKPWMPAPPDRAAERDHDPESLTASTGRLIEALSETRRERDAARREAEQQRLRATALLHHLIVLLSVATIPRACRPASAA